MKKNTNKIYDIILAILVVMMILVLSYIFVGKMIKSKEDKSQNLLKRESVKPEIELNEKTIPKQEKKQEIAENTKKEDIVKEEEKESDVDEKTETEKFFSTSIKDRLQNLEGVNSVGFIDLENPENEILINSQKQRSASIIKLFIMAKAFEDIKNDKLRYESVIDDMNLMIRKSDNQATNNMIEKLGMDSINDFIKRKGFNDTVLGRKMLDERAISQGRDNYTSSADIIKFFRQLNDDTLVEGKKDMILKVMNGQERRNKIPYLLDEKSLKIYNKTGEYAKYHVENDCAMIEISGDEKYAVSILCQGADSQEQINLIRNISKEVFNFYKDLKEGKNN